MVVSERLEQVDLFGRIAPLRSPDGGRTWDGGYTMIDMEPDDRDPGIAVFRHGTALVTWCPVPEVLSTCVEDCLTSFLFCRVPHPL
jgi:hypothetical protein